jgi:hypothetical protein
MKNIKEKAYAPIKLVLMIVGSATMFAITKKITSNTGSQNNMPAPF